MNKVNLILSIAVSAIILVGAGWGLEQHWNDKPIIAEEISKVNSKVEDALFCAVTNKEMYLEIKLKEICKKYGRTYPCTTKGMTDSDEAEYNQYKQWLEEIKKQITSFFRKSIQPITSMPTT